MDEEKRCNTQQSDFVSQTPRRSRVPAFAPGNRVIQDQARNAQTG